MTNKEDHNFETSNLSPLIIEAQNDDMYSLRTTARVDEQQYDQRSQYPSREIPTTQFSPNSLPFTTTTTTVTQSTLRKRNRVRFEDETNLPPLAKKSRVIDSCYDHDYLLARKNDLWVSSADSLRIRAEARQQAGQLRQIDDWMVQQQHAHLSFSETYANVYAVCHDMFRGRSISPEILTFLSLGDGRGLEDQTSPRIAIERRIRRQQTLRTVVQAHQRWADMETVRQVAETLTAPSRRFAEVLGWVDASAAVLGDPDVMAPSALTATLLQVDPTKPVSSLDGIVDSKLLVEAACFDCSPPRARVVATAAAAS